MLDANIISLEGAKGTAEEFWNSIESAVRGRTDELFAAALAEDKDRAQILAEKKQSAINNERCFVEKIYNALSYAVASGKEVVVLFDIDETIGSPGVRSGQVETLLRPALMPVLEKIRSVGGHVGILSSRKKETMIQQLEEPHHLKQIAPYVDKDLVYSSGEAAEISDSGAFIDILKTSYVDAKIVDRDLVNTVDKYELPITLGDIKKLAVVKDIRRKNPDTAFVIVDDARYPRFLDKANNLFGIALTHTDGMFFKP